MKPDFLLTNRLSKKLYNKVARDLPIIDFHNHLSINEIIKNQTYENITKVWIENDPYKHRVMRILGVKEKYITGKASDFEKFKAWYNSLPRLIGTPVFDWAQMEISCIFDINLLPFKTPEDIYDKLNNRLKKMTVKDILDKFNIEYSAPCTTLCEDISVFDKDNGLVPSLRGDNLILPDKKIIRELEEVLKTKITSLDEYISAVSSRLEEFKKAGCIFTDHALDNGFEFIKDDGKNDKRFKKIIENEEMKEDKKHLSSYLLKKLGVLYEKYGFTVQLHIGAQRNTSSKLASLAGPAGGYAAIGNSVNVLSLINLLDEIEKEANSLPRILIFTLNPSDNAVLATLCGSYSKDGEEGIISQGPAWWWCDHYRGICDMLEIFMSHSVLSSFIGMTTDSRSVFSFVRHDYFRRVLCEWVSEMVKKERLPNDYNMLSDLILKVCYKNAKKITGGE